MQLKIKKIGIAKIFHRSLVKETFIYTAIDALGKAIGFLMLPVVSYYLPPEEMGLATNFTVLTTIVSLLAGQAIVNSIPFFFYEQSKDQNRELISNLFLICFTICFLLGLVSLLFGNYIEIYLKLNDSIQVLAIFAVMANLIVSASLIVIRLENKAVCFAKFGIMQIILHLVFVVLFVIILCWGGRGKIYSEVLVALVMSTIHLYRMYKQGYIFPQRSKTMIYKLLKFGIPLLPHSLSFWFKGGMDKIFITTYCGLAMNGIYSMALTITSIYTIITQAFFNAYTPYLQKKLAMITPETEYSTKRRIVRLSYILIACFLLLAIVSFFAGWVILEFIVNDKYKESVQLLPGLLLGLYIYAVYSFSIQFVYKMKKTFALGCITFTGSIIQLLLSYSLIKQLGVMGSVYSSIIGSMIISTSVFILSYKVYPMPWFSLLRGRRK